MRKLLLSLNTLKKSSLLGSRSVRLLLGQHFSRTMVHLAATPRAAMMDEKVKVKVTGLDPHQQVTMSGLLKDGNNTFVSYGHYTATESGCVDISELESSGGTYTGCEPMGLVWSLTSLEPRQRIRKRDVTTPHHIKLSVLANHVAADECVHGNGVLAGTSLERHYMASHVRRVPVKEGRLRGTLFIPNEAQGRHPGVIDLYGSTGGLAEYRASVLASRGFTTLALAYLGYEDLPKNDLEMEYFLEAVDWLGGHDNVVSERVGAVSISQGAELALHLATICPKLCAVAAIGSTHFRQSNAKFQGKTYPMADLDLEDVTFEDDGMILSGLFKPSKDYSHCLLEIEKARHTNFMFIHGTDDLCVSVLCPLSAAFRLANHQHNNFSTLIYNGAGHLIEPPYTPFCYSSIHRRLGYFSVWGGEAKAHSKAQEHMWPRLLHFLRSSIMEPVPSKL